MMYESERDRERKEREGGDRERESREGARETINRYASRYIDR